MRTVYLNDTYIQGVLGHEFGFYNNGNRGAFPNWITVDAPKTETRAVFWLALKYGFNSLWNWHAWYVAENVAVYGGESWKSPLDTSAIAIPTHAIQDHTVLWTGKDTINTDSDRGINGPIASYILKSWRQGMSDYRVAHAAQQLGVNISVPSDSVVGAGFNDWGGDSSPPWPEVYDRYADFQPHWREVSHWYETYRGALADSIIARVGEEEPGPEWYRSSPFFIVR